MTKSVSWGKNNIRIMKLKSFILSLAVLATSFSSLAETTRYVGGDISMYPYYQEQGSIYRDINGNKVDFLKYSKESGMNTMRVRLFVNPEGYTYNKSNGSFVKASDSNVCQDMDYIIPLCKEIIANGMEVMLDFHYSDTWADPAKQYTPEAWKSLSDSQLVTQIYEYTKNALQTLKQNGIVPAFIQTGNEISYGMLWGAYGSTNNSNKLNSGGTKAWSRFGNLLNSAIKACREECPESKIIIHTERVANTSVLVNFYNQMKSLNVDYDIIGTSYYPYYHGKLSQLDAALTQLENNFSDKPIMIVEAGYPLYWEFGDQTNELEYPVSEKDQEPQNSFAKALVNVLNKHSNVNGLFWWWMEYNPYGPGLSGWYNAPLIDPYTGKVTPAFLSIASYVSQSNSGDASGGSGDDDIAFDTTCDYYFLYNNNGGANWTVPGTKMTNNGDGTYSISSANISQAGSDYGWFSITSVASTDWNAINANRFGPIIDNEDPTTMVYSIVTNEAKSWQVPNGIYDVVFDAKNKKVTVKITGTQDLALDVALDIDGCKGTVTDKEISISMPKDSGSDYAYVYVTAPQAATALYYQVVKTSAVSLLALDGYAKADLKDGKYIIPLEIGTKGNLNLYYTTDAIQTVPVAYSYNVEEYTPETPDIKDPDYKDPEEGDDNNNNSGNEVQEPDTPEKPDTEDPGNDKPSTDKPGNDNGGNDKPGTETPEPEKPGNETPDNPGIDKPDNDNTGNDKPGNGDSGNDKPGNDNTGQEFPKDDEEIDPGIQGPDNDENEDGNNSGIETPGDDFDPGFNGPDADDENDPSNPDAGIDGVIDDGKPLVDYWFDLRGNRINKPSAPGIYINNGKKVLIR